MRRGRLEAPLLAFGLCAAALAIAGLPEVPPFASVESFGRSRFFVPVIGLVLFVALARAPDGPERRTADAGLLLFVVFSAFGGPLFAREADEFHGIFLLLCAAIAFIAAMRPAGERGRVPHALPFLAFLVLAALPLASTAEPQRHVLGWLRAACAGVPLLVLGRGAADVERGFACLRAFAGVAAAGIACGLIVLAQAAHHVGWDLVLRSRLPLFGAHPNIVAPYLSVAPPLLLALLASVRGRGARAFAVRAALALILAAGFAVLWRTESRTALAGAALGVAVFAGLAAAARVHDLRPTARTRLAIGAAVLLLVAVPALLLRERIEHHVTGASMQFRVYLWNTAADAIAERPWTGWGLLSSDPLVTHAEPSGLDGKPKDTHPHSLLLAIALGAGLPAAAAFLLVVAVLLARTIACVFRARAPAGPWRRTRWLALGVTASAVAMVAVNLIDQGLALDTPFPLHLGLLIGLSSLVIRAGSAGSADAAAPDAVRARRFPAILVALLAAGGCAAVVLQLGAARLQQSAVRALRAKDRAAAVRAMEWARRLDPWSLQLGVRHAEFLDEIGEREQALAALLALAREHPASWRPWEEISLIEYDRREWVNSLTALQNAQHRDPTGPLGAEWRLRSARLHVLIEQPERARQEFAGAFLLDYTAPSRQEWLFDDAGAPFLPLPGGRDRMFLRDVLAINRAGLAAFEQQDPLKARRAAVTLAKIYAQFRMLEDAVAVLDEYRAIAREEWPYIELVKVEVTTGVAAEEASAALGGEQDGNSLALTSLVEARRLDRQGETVAAMEPAKRTFALFYDLVEQQVHERTVSTIVFEGAVELGDVPLARTWSRRALYFLLAPAERARVHVELVRLLREAEGDASAGERLDRLAALDGLLAGMRPDVATLDVLEGAGRELAALARDEARAFLDGLPEAPAAELLRATTAGASGDSAAERRAWERLADLHAEWHLRLRDAARER